MLNLKQTRFVNSQHLPVVPGTTIEDEGMALVAVMVDGQTHVRPSSGAAGEAYVGVSFSRNVIPQFTSAVIEEVIPAGRTIELGRIPMAGQISGTITNVGTGAKVAANIVTAAPTNAPDVQITANGNAVFKAGQEGNLFKATFHYVPSAREAISIKGNLGNAQLSSSQLDTIGVLTNVPEISTSYFDASVDWTAAAASGAPVTVKLGANGMFTTGGSGSAIPNCVVIAAPGADSQFLTLKIGL